MRIELQPGALKLARGQTLRVSDALGSTIRCNEGSVWITEEDMPRDVVLEAGGCYRLRRATAWRPGPGVGPGGSWHSRSADASSGACRPPV